MALGREKSLQIREKGIYNFGMTMKTTVSVVAFLLLFAACTTTPVSDKTAFIVIPFSQEVAMGEQAYKDLLGKEKISSNPSLTKVAERVGRRLAATTTMPKLDWTFNVIDSNQKNAFALPGGKTAVYTGILTVCENEAGLAAVLGHEIAHVTARHSGQRISQQFLLMGAMTAASISLSNNNQRDFLLGALGLGAMYGISLPFSRSNESEADQIGLVYMAQAGYDPREAIRFWGRFSKLKGNKQPPEFLSTHPADATRLRGLQEYLPRAIRIYEALPTKYGLGAKFDPADLEVKGAAPAAAPAKTMPKSIEMLQ